MQGPLESHTFKYEANWSRWLAQVGELDFDLVVPDDSGRPSQAAIALLNEALPEVEALVSHTAAHIRGFCTEASLGLHDAPHIVELSVRQLRGKQVLQVVVNFPGDLYGLWSVGFTRISPARWFPTSFSREAW